MHAEKVREKGKHLREGAPHKGVSNSVDPLRCVRPSAELVNAAEYIVGEVDLCTKDVSSKDRQTKQ